MEDAHIIISVLLHREETLWLVSIEKVGSRRVVLQCDVLGILLCRRVLV